MMDEGFADRFEEMQIPYKHSAAEYRQRHVLSMLDRLSKMMRPQVW